MNVAPDMLRSLIERIERLNEEIKATNQDKAEVFAEAKGAGFDTKAMKIVIRRRAADTADLAEQDEIVRLYTAALE